MSDRARPTPPHQRGIVAWWAKNGVAANLLMALLIVGGIAMIPNVKQEVFPEFSLDIITITVPYPGASPAEVEQGVILAIEEAIRGIDGIKAITSTASESVGSVIVEMLTGEDPDAVLSEVKSAIDRITSFPLDAERPIVSLATNRNENVQVVVYGDISERELRDLAYDLRERLLNERDITLVELSGVRPVEISVEVPEANLRRHNLTLDGIARAISDASIEIPAGGLRTSAGEVLLRTSERREIGAEFEGITILSLPTGARVTLGEIAAVNDGFRETDQMTSFNGQRAAVLRVFRVGNQTPIEVTRAVEAFIDRVDETLPPAVNIQMVNDRSEMYQDRILLLTKNAFFGLILVLLILGIFLELKLAFWVTLGIPICFLGALLLMPAFDTSINMIALFAFILTLGIVVDDAIVVGESIYNARREGHAPLDAAIAGAREVGKPVLFSVITTMVAFVPILFVPGIFGKFMNVIPVVVLIILSLSLIECLLILPAHLAHSNPGFTGGLLGLFSKGQAAFSRHFERTVEFVYRPLISLILRFRYLMFAVAMAMLILAGSFVKAGYVGFTFMPRIEGDVVTANLRMPFGTPVEDTEAVVDVMIREANRILEANGGATRIGRGMLADVGTGGAGGGGGPGGGSAGGAGSHLAQVTVFLVPVDQRPITAGEFARDWRLGVGEIPGIEALNFGFSTGPSAGAPVAIRLSHVDLNVLESAATELGELISAYNGVIDIDNGFSPGKTQLDVNLSGDGRAMGLSERDLARQLRAAYFGVEAVRQQRGRDEVRVLVRRPASERRSEFDIEEMLLRTPTGAEIPLRSAADIERGTSYTQIRREDGRRTVTVSADLDLAVANGNEINTSIVEDILPDLLARYPGLDYALGGEQQEQAEVMAVLARGMMLALLVMYALMAVAFRSYLQPIVVMLAIPFGFIGAIGGHILMGYALSLLSLFGMVALSGVVVNASLVLITAVNDLRDKGMEVTEALVQGSVRRFRPILLTSITTFFGLAPMLLETSMQARFLIPMAISLAFGVLFASFVTLGLVPSLYLILEDRTHVLRWLRRRPAPQEPVTPCRDEDAQDHSQAQNLEPTTETSSAFVDEQDARVDDSTSIPQELAANNDSSDPSHEPNE